MTLMTQMKNPARTQIMQLESGIYSVFFSSESQRTTDDTDDADEKPGTDSN